MRKFQGSLTGRPDSLTRIRPYPVKLEVPSAPTKGRGTPVAAEDSTCECQVETYEIKTAYGEVIKAGEVVRSRSPYCQEHNAEAYWPRG